MTLTNDIIARIFGMYLGVDVIRECVGKEQLSPNALSYIDEFELWDRVSLLLTSLENISDQDAIEVDKTCSATAYLDVPKFHTATRGKVWLKDFLRGLPIKGSHIVADYLRQQGYALPAFGFSVEDLVTAGVFKIKTINHE